MDKRYLINYLRLSKGDVERRDESNSITNQRRIQDEYIKSFRHMPDWNLLTMDTAEPTLNGLESARSWS